MQINVEARKGMNRKDIHLFEVYIQWSRHSHFPNYETVQNLFQQPDQNSTEGTSDQKEFR